MDASPLAIMFGSALALIILPNVEIGDGVIIGAGSVVTKSFSANQVIGGAPCKINQRATLMVCPICANQKLM